MLDEASREFRRVAELRPSEGQAPFFLGLIAARQGRWSEAASLFRHAADRGGPVPRSCTIWGRAGEASDGAGREPSGRPGDA
jgi:hypothetical protein